MKADWTRKLSKPHGRFRRLGDIRDFILREFPKGPPHTWELIGREALEAAKGGDTSGVEAALALVMVIDPRFRR